MSRGRWAILILITVLVILAGVALFVIPAKAPTPSTNTAATTLASIPDLITVNSPEVGANISSPVSISGQARGTWFFEAQAPAQLEDASSSIIVESPLQVDGNWQTNDFVPFSLTLSFPAQPAGSHGTLVLKNDNPSGDPANQKEIDIPVIFK